MEKDKDDIKGFSPSVGQPYWEPEAKERFKGFILLNSGTTHPSFADPRFEQLELSHNQTVIRVHALEQQIRELSNQSVQSSSFPFPHGEVNKVEDVLHEQAKSLVAGYPGEHAREKIDVSSLLEKLDGVYEESSSESWDGYDAKPLSEEAYLEARKLLGRIPLEFPAPDIVAEPEGDIGFEWYRGKGFSLVLSLDGSKTITYAARFGRNETYGTEELTESFPEAITHFLKRLYTTSNE